VHPILGHDPRVPPRDARQPERTVQLVVDFEDAGIRVLERMAAKRRAGYRLLGCTVVAAAPEAGAQLALR
jgi:hypothetical protein